MKIRNWKYFIITLFWKQNKWHSHSVFIHTLKVTYYAVKTKNYKMIPAALLHDFGKPFTAHKDNKDVVDGTFSFKSHEEISYQIIKHCAFISDYTKTLVRYHYLLRGKEKAKEKGQYAKFRRLTKIYDGLTDEFKNDLIEFQKLDDLGK